MKNFIKKINLSRFNLFLIILLLGAISFSIIRVVFASTPDATKPNPGQAWNEIGTGSFQVTGPTGGPSAPKTFIFPDVDNTYVITAPTPVGTAGQVLTSTGALGQQSWATPTFGNVNGTGATNYVTKWSNTTGTLVNSSIFDNGTSIGIGTATPGANLDVKAPTSGNSTFRLTRGSAQDYGLQLTADQGAGNVYIDSIGDNANPVMQFRMRTLGTPITAMTILGSGNIGVGTTAPGGKLDVRGNIILGIGGSERLYGGAGLSYIEPYNASTGDMTFYGTYGTGGFNFNTANNATAKVRIDSAGNVGIGTTAPVSKLDVADNISMIASGGLLINGYYNGGWKYRGNGYLNAVYQTGTGDFNFDTAGNNTGGVGIAASPTTKMTILNNGNVGIGTTAPTAKLHIGGTAGVDGLRYPDNTLQLSAVQGPGYYRLTSAGVGTLVVSGNSVYKSAGANAWDSAVYSQDGYIGGVFASFVVTDLAHSFMMGLNTDPITGGYAYGSLDYTWYVPSATGYAYESGTPSAQIATIAVGDVLAVTYDGTNIRYLQNGIVRRTVAATITAPLYLDSSFAAPSATTGVTNIQFGPMMNQGSQWAANGTSIYYNNGSVGVGTTAPTEILDVSQPTGDINVGIWGNLGSNTGDKGSVIFKQKIGGGNAESWIGQIKAVAGGTTATQRMDFNMGAWNNNKIVSNVMTLLGNGNVGIGTTAPTTKLNINDSTATNASANLDLSITGHNAVIQTAMGNNRYFSFPVASLEMLTTTNTPITFGVNKTGSSNPDMTIINGGNVGIGTTAPATPLHVLRATDGTALTVENTTAAISGIVQKINATRAATNAYWFLEANANGVEQYRLQGDGSTVQTGNNTALSFIKSGGTAAQFLKADGSIDSNTYMISGSQWTTSGTNLYDSLAGNVGIGTTAPQDKFTTAGDHLFAQAGAAGSSYGKLEAVAAGDKASWGTAANIDFFRPTGSLYGNDGEIRFSTSPGVNGVATPTQRMVIADGGNVGIGTTAPKTKLQVVEGAINNAWPTPGTASGVFSVLANANAYGMYFGVRNTDGVGWIQNMRQDADATTYPIILQPGGGNIGIGTTAPRTTLDTGTGTMSGAANDYIKAQFTITGGGTITWGGQAGRLKWTARFIAIPVSQTSAASGYIDLIQPVVNIPAGQVYNGVARAADATGVVLNSWEALYAVHTVGGVMSAVNYYIVNYITAFNAPSNWILIAAVNGDDNSVRLANGYVLKASGSYTAGTDAQYLTSSSLSGYLPLTGGTLTGNLSSNSNFISTNYNAKFAVKGPNASYARLGALDIANSVNQAVLSVNASPASDGNLYQDDASQPTWTLALNAGGAGGSDSMAIKRAAAGSTLNTSLSTLFSINSSGAVTAGLYNGQTISSAANFTGSVTAASLIKSGGTAAQFLKADGSIDSSVYMTSGSQWTTSGTGLYDSLAGNVSIGSANVGISKLYVTGGVIYSDNAGKMDFALNSIGSNYGYIQNDGANTWSLATGTISPTIGTLGTPVLTWNSSGNVGIGTTNPGSYKLSLSSSDFRVLSLNSTYGQVNMDFANSGVYFGSIGSGVSQIAGGSPTDLGFGTMGTAGNIVFGTGASYLERMRITSGGNVGIGTTTPNYPLHINGNMSFSGNQQTPNYIFANGGGDNSELLIKAGSTASVISQIEVTGNWNGTAATGGKIAFTTGGAEHMRIDPAGNVGIGTTNPLALLSVGSTSQFQVSSAGAVTIAATAGTMTGTANGSNYGVYTPATNTGTGVLFFQAGAGSAGYGGGLTLYSNANASFPGWVKAGISSGSGGKFSVNSSGLGTGTDVFTVDASGNTVANGTLTSGLINGQTISSAANFTGSVTATSFIKSGGTSSQFLKADGSVDSSTFVSSSSPSFSGTLKRNAAGTGYLDGNAVELTTTNGVIYSVNPTGGTNVPGGTTTVGTMLGIGFATGTVSGVSGATAGDWGMYVAGGTNNVAKVFLDGTSGAITSAGAITAAGTVTAPTLAVTGNGQFMAGTSVAGGSQNMKLKGGPGNIDVGLTAYNSADTWVWQIYGAGTTYGFLGGNWGGWDIMKTIGGAMVLNGSQTVITSASIGSQNVAFATNATNATTTRLVSSPDGDRNAATKLPTTNGQAVRFDFDSASSAGMPGGSYAGVMTYAPYDGTSSSTGDASYQLAFGGTAANGGGVPVLNIRKGIDSTWNSWYNIITSANIASQTVSSAGILTGSAHTNGSDGWFRSAGAAGWYNETYAVGIYATEVGNVRTYNSANFIAGGTVTGSNLSGTNTGDNAVNSLYSGLAASKYDASNPSGYITSAYTGFQGISSNLTALTSFYGGSTLGFVKWTAAGAFAMDTTVYAPLASPSFTGSVSMGTTSKPYMLTVAAAAGSGFAVGWNASGSQGETNLYNYGGGGGGGFNFLNYTSSGSAWPTTGGTSLMYLNASGYVGIGNTLPLAKLHITAGNAAAIMMTYDTGNNHRNIISNNWVTGNAGSSNMSFAVYNGTATASLTTLTLNGLGNGLLAGCLVYNGGSLGTCLSDMRLKKDINNFNLGLKDIIGLNPVTYQYNGLGGTTADGKVRTGFIAQQVQSVSPGFVSEVDGKLNPTDTVSQKFLQVDYNAISFALVNAVKELNTRVISEVSSISNQLVAIVNRLDGHDKRIAQLEKDNAALKSLVCIDHPTAAICQNK